MTPESSVLLDALLEGRDVRELVTRIYNETLQDGAMIQGDVSPVQSLRDGCCGDTDGLCAALKQPHAVLYSACRDEGYGHHSYNEIIVLDDGRIIHAECGGCSCDGSGSWSFCATPEEAERLIPEQERA